MQSIAPAAASSVSSASASSVASSVISSVASSIGSSVSSSVGSSIGSSSMGSSTTGSSTTGSSVTAAPPPQAASVSITTIARLASSHHERFFCIGFPPTATVKVNGSGYATQTQSVRNCLVNSSASPPLL